MPLILVLAAGAALVLVTLASALWQRRARRLQLANIREWWGKPFEARRDMQRISLLHELRASSGYTAPHTALDDQTWNDMAMDDVFPWIDRCVSRTGQQMLYSRLRDSGASDAQRNTTDELADVFLRDEKLRGDVQAALLRLGDEIALELPNVIISAPGVVPKLPAVAPLLSATVLVAATATLFWPTLLPLLLLVVVVAVVVRLPISARLGPQKHQLGALSRLVGTARELRTTLARSEAVRTEMLPDEARINSLSAIERAAAWLWMSRDSSESIAALVLEILNHFLMLDVLLIHGALSRLERDRENVREVFEWVGSVDIGQAVASVRAGTPIWSRPKFSAGRVALTVRRLVHPTLLHPVANDVRLAAGRGMLLTGANMSGKSTLLRAIGISVIMGQALHTAFAEEYEGPQLALRSSMSHVDELLSGTSLYLAEAKSAVALINAMSLPGTQLVLVDELFRSTNAIERFAVSEAFLRHMVSGNALVLAATHDLELVRRLQQDFAPWHLHSDFEGGEPVFTHELREGPTDARSAIALLRTLGAPPGILREAVERCLP